MEDLRDLRCPYCGGRLFIWATEQYDSAVVESIDCDDCPAEWERDGKCVKPGRAAAPQSNVSG